ncbi:hypothetical protein QN277_015913 [Acacia crassicarpa]|uniref:Geranylgeranyl diphosphate synthase n=1 Tax=Acacia crassicarpa TaxID=499986 RepID=A0AAE1K1Q1_9FABA|nr:hypothetical protein QN277_015913 [Acacia crassicarpa]
MKGVLRRKMASSVMATCFRSSSLYNLNGFKTSKVPIKSRFCKPLSANKKVNAGHASNFEFQEYMAAKIKKVNKALDEAVPLHHPTKLSEAMRYSLLSKGKRVCPLLCIASCELVGGEESIAVPVACATEMLVTVSMIQDDLPCMDNDEIRRGIPTTHKVFGEDTTILCGNSLICLAFQHIADKTDQSVPPKRVLRAISELGLAEGSKGLSGGQFLDLNSEGKMVTLSELECIHTHKTAKLVEATAVCGAIIGGGSEKEVERLRNYGGCIGLIHQVVDDILGVTKSTEELGKTAGKDLISDKATYPKLMGVDGAKKFATELLDKALAELSYFDAKKAAPLYHLAKYFVDRQK